MLIRLQNKKVKLIKVQYFKESKAYFLINNLYEKIHLIIILIM